MPTSPLGPGRAHPQRGTRGRTTGEIGGLTTTRTKLNTAAKLSTKRGHLTLLAIADAKSENGPGIHGHVRRISQGDGMKVYDVPQGLAALAKRQRINYEGASGPCDFNEIGDILDCKFRFQTVQNGKLVLAKIA